ncbi:YbaK/EbsC family protein [Sutterella sp.]|uniref:YbaK/EbsC family protein n=1 Tax=Sutterella sp. TaxID=1981025 RepID=UPI003FD78C55
MSFAAAQAWLAERGFQGRIHRFSGSSATVELAAHEIGVEPARIAKTMAVTGPEGPILIVAAGDVRLDGGKFKRTFHVKPHFIAPADVEAAVGHAPGGVCPFGVKAGVPVYLDLSLKAYPTVWPACGDESSGVELTLDELEHAVVSAGWVDLTRPPKTEL